MRQPPAVGIPSRGVQVPSEEASVDRFSNVSAAFLALAETLFAEIAAGTINQTEALMLKSTLLPFSLALAHCKAGKPLIPLIPGDLV